MSFKKRDNASEWENRTNGCVEYVCDEGVHDALYWSKCNSSNEVTRMCENETCVTVDLEKEEFYVEVTLEGVKATEMNETEVRNVLEVVSGVKSDEVKIETEIDEEGNIIRIIVIVEDLETAQTISDAVNAKCV